MESYLWLSPLKLIVKIYWTFITFFICAHLNTSFQYLSIPCKVAIVCYNIVIIGLLPMICILPLLKGVCFSQRSVRQACLLLLCLVKIKHLIVQCWPNLQWGRFNKTLHFRIVFIYIICKANLKLAHGLPKFWPQFHVICSSRVSFRKRYINRRQIILLTAWGHLEPSCVSVPLWIWSIFSEPLLLKLSLYLVLLLLFLCAINLLYLIFICVSFYICM